MGSSLTVMESLLSTATVGFIFLLATHSMYPKNYYGYAFVFGMLLEFLVNKEISLWYKLFDRHAIPIGKNLLVTALLLFLLYQRGVVTRGNLILIGIIYAWIVQKSLFPLRDGYDANAARGWWKNPR